MTESEIKLAAQRLGFDLAGICDASVSPESWSLYQGWIERGMHAGMSYLSTQAQARSSLDHVLPGARSAIVVAQNYAQPSPWKPGYPRVARYALNRDYHNVIRKRLKKLVAAIQPEFPESAFRVCVDSAPIFERELAHRAGLGWFGKNTMLINSWRGSWTLLGVVLTTAQLTPDQPAEGGCGSCRLCIENCPTGAIVFEADRWQVDARRCISYWTIEHRGEIPSDLHGKIGDWTFGCDICQEVCPFNQPRESQPLRAAETDDPDFRSHREWPTLEKLRHIEDAEFDALTLGSPLRRARQEGLQRNARINLQNRSNSDDPI